MISSRFMTPYFDRLSDNLSIRNDRARIVIATVSADSPEGFALGLAKKILRPLGARWFYEGESLGSDDLCLDRRPGFDDYRPD
jgi:hypothetical protein